MEKILSVKEVRELPVQAIVRNTAIISNVSWGKRASEDRSDRIYGYLRTVDGEIKFNIWSDRDAYKALESYASPETEVAKYTDLIISFEGKKGEWQGTPQITIENLEIVDDGSVTKDDFVEKPYNKSELSTKLTDLIKRNVSTAGVEIIKEFFKDKDEAARFEVEYAATSHHDNVPNGLMAHTMKVMLHIEHLINVYPSLVEFEADDGLTVPQRKDLLYIGALIHDIDKITEMQDGAYQSLYGQNHRTLCIQRIERLRDIITSKYNKVWIDNLTAMVSQHHGEYGDPITTLFSKILHEADNLDAKYTEIASSIKDPIMSNSGQYTVKAEVVVHTERRTANLTI